MYNQPRLHPCARLWQIKLATKIIPQYVDPGFVYDDLLRCRYKDATVWVDAGCGYNLDIKQADDFPGFSIGFDIEKIKQADYLRGSIYEIPIKTNAADFISNRWVVEHLQEPATAMDELYRVLKPGKTLLIRTTNRFHYTSFFSRLLPMWIKRILVASKIFPTFYRLNTRVAWGQYFSRVLK